MTSRAWLAAAALAALALSALAPLTASAAEAFGVSRVWFAKKDGGYAVRANLQVGPRARLDKILRGGYQVDLRFELRFMQTRNWWPDREVGDIAWNGALSYDALTQRYTLRRGFGSARRFADLDSAAQEIARLRAGAERDAGYIKILESDDVYALARFYVQRGKLPVPMQIEMLFDFDDWDGADNWTTFPLEIIQQP